MYLTATTFDVARPGACLTTEPSGASSGVPSGWPLPSSSAVGNSTIDSRRCDGVNPVGADRPHVASDLGQGRRSLRHQPHLSYIDPNPVDAIGRATRTVSNVAGGEISEVLWVLVVGYRTIDSQWWSQAILTCAQAGFRRGDLPLVNLPWDHTREVADTTYDRVPKHAKWDFMTPGPARRRCPSGSQPQTPAQATLRRSGLSATGLASADHSLPADARCGNRNEVPTTVIPPGLGIRRARQP